MSKNNDNIGKINKVAFWPAVIALLLFIGIGIVKTEVVGSFMTRALYIIADYFGAYINILSLIFLILAGIIIISRYGDIVIGGKDAKPDYSMLSWCAMSICSGIGVLFNMPCMQCVGPHLLLFVIIQEKAYLYHL